MNDADTEDTLRMLGEAAEAFARPDAQRTRKSRDGNQGFDPAVWKEIRQMGWLAATVPEACGGLGFGLRAGTVLARRLGYAGYLEPFVGVGVMAVGCLAACEQSERRTERLHQIVENGLLVGLAWQPVNGAFDVDATEVVATEEEGVVRLSGACRFVTVPQAEAFIVAARSGDNVSLYWVERGLAGFSVQLEQAVDGTALGRLTLADVRLPDRTLLTCGAQARRAMEDAIDAGVISTAAELLGVIERSLDITIEYLKTRQQFGQPIGAFQALQHRAVDMWIQKELTRAALTSALKVIEDAAASADARRAVASSVKARASQAALYVCGQAVQLHGAVGFTDEYELGIYVNRGLTLAARFGNAAQHRRRYGALTPVIER
jgi:alkylation response protein AidB-like acyl-CoA dehydrogenase